jgi:hypothetical protein
MKDLTAGGRGAAGWLAREETALPPLFSGPGIFSLVQGSSGNHSKSTPEFPLPMRQLNVGNVGSIERNFSMTANLADQIAVKHDSLLRSLEVLCHRKSVTSPI